MRQVKILVAILGLAAAVVLFLAGRRSAPTAPRTGPTPEEARVPIETAESKARVDAETQRKLKELERMSHDQKLRHGDTLLNPRK